MFEATVWRTKAEMLEKELTVTKAFHDVAVQQRDHERWKNDRLAAALKAVVPTMDEVRLDGIEATAQRYNGAGVDTVLALVAEVRRLQSAVKKMKDVEALRDC
jgi:hypothetical protein